MPPTSAGVFLVYPHYHGYPPGRHQLVGAFGVMGAFMQPQGHVQAGTRKELGYIPVI